MWFYRLMLKISWTVTMSNLNVLNEVKVERQSLVTVWKVSAHELISTVRYHKMWRSMIIHALPRHLMEMKGKQFQP